MMFFLLCLTPDFELLFLEKKSSLYDGVYGNLTISLLIKKLLHLFLSILTGRPFQSRRVRLLTKERQ